MRFLQGNDILELIRNRASVQKRRFALKMLIIHYLYLISMLGTVAVCTACALILLFSQRTVLAVVFFGIAAVCAVFTLGMLRRRPQFLRIREKTVFNILFAAAPIVCLIVCMELMLIWIACSAFWVAMWVFTVWGYLYSRR